MGRTYKSLFLFCLITLFFKSTLELKLKSSQNPPNVNTNAFSIVAGGANPPSNSASISTTAGNGNGNTSALSSSLINASPDTTGSANSLIFSAATPNGLLSGSKTSSVLLGGTGGLTFSSNTASSSTNLISNPLTNAMATTNSNTSPSNVAITSTSNNANNISIPDKLINFNVLTANFKFTLLNIPNVSDLSISYGGVLGVISNNMLQFYNFLTNSFTIYNSNFQIQKISIAPDGTPYVISNNEIYYSPLRNTIWIKIANLCADEISVSNTGEVYVIECNKNEILQIYCRTDSNSNYSKNLHLYNNPQFYTVNLHGYGTKIKVIQDGVPIIVSNNNQLMYYSNSNWLPFLGMFGKDISVSNDGMVFITAYDGGIFSINYLIDTPIIYKIAGTATLIRAGPFSKPFVLTTDNQLHSSLDFVF